MTRNELTEHLLGREIQYRFVSIAEAKALYTQLYDGAGQCDLKLLEVALQAPMYEVLNNESAGVHELAEVMMAAINELQPFKNDSQFMSQKCADLFLAKN
ncbi:MAG: hypothetical protein U0998_09265 [Moraxellaceae bacterium]|nr:hypothetical protein [Moraxellaceae bacterium]MDZ4387367.1 hypothetical protein [Moraxellaceae bacterium]